MTETTASLSDRQLRALFNILVHHETYAEVQSFKGPEGIRQYGYPFIDWTSQNDEEERAGQALSETPLLQLLLTRFVLPAPGFRDLPSEFWGVKFRGIMERLGEADLSESYDKGTLGTRKRLACAATVIHEAVTRGLLAGLPERAKQPDLQQEYDLTTAEGITKAYDDAVTALVYGDLAEELFNHLSATPDFESHSRAVQGGMDYAIIHVATLLHYIFVLSTEGPYLLKLIENLHGMMPYNLIKQTLKVGNAATMINGMARLFLAKVSVGAVTNWFGLTKDASDGMNLMQRMISMILDWDANDFRKAASRIRKAQDRIEDKYFDAIDKHVSATSGHGEEVRIRSQEECKSIAVTIFEDAGLSIPDPFSAEQHKQCLDYYAAKLAVRDREVSSGAFCNKSPDFTTGMVRDALAAFDAMIRMVHDKVDLKKLVSAAQDILTDIIAVSKCQSDESEQKQKAKQKDATVAMATVDDYVALLHKHKKTLMYDYLHAVAKGCPEIKEMWCQWMIDTAKIFRENYDSDQNPTTTKANQRKDVERRSSAETNTEQTRGMNKSKVFPEDRGAGRLSHQLQDLFENAPSRDQEEMLSVIDEYGEYLDELEDISRIRMQRIIDKAKTSSSSDMSHEGTSTTPHGSNMTGPGVYLAMFEQLLNNTLITPDVPNGTPRRGKDVKSELGHGKTAAVTAAASASTSTNASRTATPSVRSFSSTSSRQKGVSSRGSNSSGQNENDSLSIASNLNPEAPDTEVVTETLGAQFRKMVAQISAKGLPVGNEK